MEEARQNDTANVAAATCCAAETKGGRLNRRTLFIGLAVAGGAAGMFLGWDWLVATGLASLVLGVLPCVAMCAFGLCAGRMMQSRQRPGGQSTPPSVSKDDSGDLPTQNRT
jgi:hypothetical protein